MWIYLIQGVGYGFAAAAQPGPFQTYLISQTLTRGWKRTLAAAFAPLVSDGPIITLCLLVLSQVPAWMLRFLYFAGGIFVLYLAFGAFRAWRDFIGQDPAQESATSRSVFNAAMINALSPGPYIYWTLVTGPILLRAWREAPLYGLGFLGGFYVTIVLSLMAIVVVFGTARRLGPKVNRALLGVSALALLGFGIYQLWLGINSA
jgi:threonine/homoserine/homoserine lactone efflux protein